jgi:hypothetical protein
VKKPGGDQRIEPPAKMKDAWDTHDVNPHAMYRGFTTAESRPEPQSRLTRRIKSLLTFGLLGALVAGAFTAAQFVPPPASLFANTGVSKGDRVSQYVELPSSLRRPQ